MAANKWIFSIDRLTNTPSRKCGIDSEKESSYRQQAASLIQDMGQKLLVTQLCINTAIVYMHRFYMFHSFTKFNRTSMSGACLFLAAKVEEQPRKLEHVIRTGYMCTHRDQPQLDVKSDSYLELAQELVIDENILLQTLGFEITVDHPHTHIVKTCNLVRASKDLAQTSYFLATNSLHLTSMCLQYPSTVVACVCIHLACKWSSFEIPQSSEGRAWYYYVDTNVTAAMLEAITQEFLAVFEKCPSKMRKKLINHKSSMEEFAHNIPERKQGEKYPLASAALPSCVSSVLQSSLVKDKPSGSDKAGSGSKFRQTNHDRMLNQPSTATSLLSVDHPETDHTSQPQTVPGIGVEVALSQLPLRRVKTEGSTLSAKEYFERKEREKLDKDASKLESRSSKELAKPVQEPRSQELFTEPANSDPVKAEHKLETVRGGCGPSAGIKEQTKLSAEISRGQPLLISSRASNCPKVHAHRLQKSVPPTNRNLGMYDPSDQRPVNIFDCFQPEADSMSSQIDQLAVPSNLNESVIPTEVSFSSEGCVRPGGKQDMVPKPEHESVTLSLHGVDDHSLHVQFAHHSSLHGQAFNGGHRLSQPSRRNAQDNIAHDITDDSPQNGRKNERRRSSHHDHSNTPISLSPVTPVVQPSSGEPTDIGTLQTKNYEQRLSRRKQPSDSSQPSPLKIKLSVACGVGNVDSSAVSHKVHTAESEISVSGQPKVHDLASSSTAPSSFSESQERIRLKLNLSGGKVENLSDPVASSSTSRASTGVKLVLSKDKLSGEYQPGSSGHHHRHRHSHRDHHLHKHIRPDIDGQLASAESSSRKRPAPAGDVLLKPPPDKVHRTETSLGNGHHAVASGQSSHQHQQETFPVLLTSNNIFPSVAPSPYRTARVLPPPPPPPPPLPLEEPSAPPPPPMP